MITQILVCMVGIGQYNKHTDNVFYMTYTCTHTHTIALLSLCTLVSVINLQLAHGLWHPMMLIDAI